MECTPKWQLSLVRHFPASACKLHLIYACYAVNGDTMEFECKWVDMYEITEQLHSTAGDIKRSDELAGDYREVHNVATDGR